MRCEADQTYPGFQNCLASLPDEISLLAQLRFSSATSTLKALTLHNQVPVARLRYLLGILVRDGLVKREVYEGDWLEDPEGQKTCTLYRLTPKGREMAPVRYKVAT